MNVVTGAVRGLIVAVGVALVIVGPTDLLRLFGVLAIVFGAFRLYLLFRHTADESD
ncbi:MAG: hypothetical protein RML15_01095 [Bacteroidota bacterium]|nr:hypothetical protein [Candidatus Kapabacteria bacterium]MCS7302010.1 hypothetical protein [Candidatus Kapabacteria bacterium]MCX7936810.1 hypothetical protein [Chlorobiota bacterium]MDW8074529.1 hypothetical protein [Bacteroidota bacterium]MDW8270995.1 hypothetical protein [Bacteroidota bacterium]